MIVDTGPTSALFNHFAAMRTITDLKLVVLPYTVGGIRQMDTIVPSLLLLAPNLVTLNINTPLASVFPLLAKCESLAVTEITGMDLVGPQDLPALRELNLRSVEWDGDQILGPFFRGRPKKLEKLHMVIEVSHEDCHSMEEAEDQNSELIELGRDSAVQFEWDIEMSVSVHCLCSAHLSTDVDDAVISLAGYG